MPSRLVVLGGRTVVPALLSLALTLPGAAWAAGAAPDGVSHGPVDGAAPAVITALADRSTLHAGDPVSPNAELSGQPSEVPTEGVDAQAPAPSGDTSSLPPVSGVALMDIGSALTVTYALPVISIDAARRPVPHSVAGWLRGAARGTRVEVALRRGGAVSGCGWWVKAALRFAPATRAACGKPRWQRAAMRGAVSSRRWHVSFGRPLPCGDYSLVIRVLDGQDRPLDVERR